jgi:hypothetical protein
MLTAMRLLLMAVFFLGACSGGYAASDLRTGTQTTTLKDGLVPRGARLYLRLESPVDDEAPAGEGFRARVLGSLFTPDGDMLVPRGALVEGRVVGDGSRWLAVHSLEMGGIDQVLVGHVVGATPPGRLGIERPVRMTAAQGLVDDLPAGTRLEIRLCAPLAPLPGDEDEA